MTIRDRECKIDCANSPKICRVTVASSTHHIQPRCVVNVKYKVEQGSVVGGMTGVLESEQRFEERYSVGIIKVVATVKEGGVPVRLFNPNHKPARIYRGSTVGKLCPAQDPREEDLTEPQSCYHICPSSCEPKSKGGSSSTMILQEDNQKKKEAMAEMFEIDNPNLSTEEKETVYESHLHITTLKENESTSSGLYTVRKRSIRYEIV